ncbi:MAG: hypothetical protein AAGB34_07390 [Planctomycetota bacterium]
MDMFDWFVLARGAPCVGVCALALAAAPANAVSVAQGSTVAFASDDSAYDALMVQSIEAAGHTAVAITEFATFDFSQVDMLWFEDDSNTAFSPTFAGRQDDIEAYVRAGGRLMIHDRSTTAAVSENYFLGAPTIEAINFTPLTPGEEINRPIADAGSNPVTDGPFGTITDTTLDNALRSVHGAVTRESLLTVNATAILTTDDPNEVVAFSYALDDGFLYYANMPVLFNATNTAGLPQREAFRDIYLPNAIDYVVNIPTPSSLVLLALLAGASRRRRS